MAIRLFTKKREYRESLLKNYAPVIRCETINTYVEKEELEESIAWLICNINGRGRIIKNIAFNEKTYELYFLTKVSYSNIENRFYSAKAYFPLMFPWRKQFEFDVVGKDNEVSHFVFWEKPLRKPYYL